MRGGMYGGMIDSARNCEILEPEDVTLQYYWLGCRGKFQLTVEAEYGVYSTGYVKWL